MKGRRKVGTSEVFFMLRVTIKHVVVSSVASSVNEFVAV